MTARRWLMLASCLLLAGGLWIRHIAASGEVAGFFRDEGVYLVTSRALASSIFRSSKRYVTPRIVCEKLIPGSLRCLPFG